MINISENYLLFGFLKAKLFCIWKDVTPSLAHSLTSHLGLSTIYPLFVDRFGRSLWIDKEAILDGSRSENARYREGVLNLKKFKRAQLLWSL